MSAARQQEMVFCLTLVVQRVHTRTVFTRSSLTTVVAHITFISGLINRSDVTNGQTFGEMAGKHAVEEPKQAFFQKITASFKRSSLMSARIPSMPGLLPRFNCLIKADNSSRVTSLLKQALRLSVAGVDTSDARGPLGASGG